MQVFVRLLTLDSAPSATAAFNTLDSRTESTPVSNTIWSGPILSGRRLVVCLCITSIVVTTDVLFFHTFDITTPLDFVTEVVIHALGFYGGFTLIAVLD
jgi:hypothetical protein